MTIAAVKTPEGLTPNSASEIIDKLTVAVAETSVTRMKAQNFHWNVKGMSFGSLHKLFGKIYKDHDEGIDDMAERVKALGGHAEGRYAQYLHLSSIEESDGHLSAVEMIAQLMGDERTLSTTYRSLAELAEKNNDLATSDMAIKRAEAHDKFAWMLAAHLEE